MKNLRSLRVTYACGLQKRYAVQMLESLPLLEELILSEFNMLDKELVNNLVINTPNMRRLYLKTDFVKDLHYNERNT